MTTQTEPPTTAPDEAAYDHRRLRQWLAGRARAETVDRRDLLRLLAATGLATALPPALTTGAHAATRAVNRATAPGIVKPLPVDRFTIRGTNAETNFAALAGTGHSTPASHFFVRNHTSTPLVDPAAWELRLWGSGLTGRQERTFTLADLKRLPAVTRSAFVECAGNGRSFYASQQGRGAEGTAWTLGAIGSARWRGARLADVLRLAGIRRDAVDVLPRGLDPQYVTADGTDLGRVRRPLPVPKALDDVLLAYEMNGEPLPPDHGAPVRLLVPSWIGIASTKWVGDIEVSREPLFSPWNTIFYRLFGEAYPPEGGTPLTRQTLKSAFELPWNATLPAHTRHHLTGRSWSGTGTIARVDVSTDAGRTWHRARLHDTPRRGDWIRWSSPWHPTTKGPAELLARATDTTGHTQPTTTVHNTQGYLFDAVVRHAVTVV
ncbi:sulfite oxidase [Streptomyces sp. NPDC016845]|uniref:sulfite oxidase n=1 Tax=Streptomyces sp. NPDC016845 TaxID=3364972 RepID=UPI0037A19BFB